MSANSFWQTTKLGSHATIKARIGWKGLQASEYKDAGYIFLATPNIKGYEIDFNNVNYISERRYNESPELKLQVGDVLLVKDGSTLGISNLIRKLPGPATVNSSIAVLRCSNELVPSFLHQLTKGNSFQKLIVDKKSGLGVPHLFQADLKEFEISLPTIGEQHRIAEILDALDEAIQKTDQFIAKLKQLKRGLLHDLLSRGIDGNGQLRDPVAHPEQFKDSVLGRIPTAWEAVRIKDVGKVFGGKRLPAGHAYSEEPTGYTYLRVLDFFEKAIDPKTLMSLPPKTFAALERYEIHDGNLFISIAGSIGHVGVFTATENTRTVLTENAARIELAEEMHPPFVAYQMNGHEVQRQIDIEKGTGGGVPKLALFRIEDLRITQPPETEQKAISQRMLAHEKAIALEEENLQKLMAIKKGLMHDLLTGKVRVNTKEGNDK